MENLLTIQTISPDGIPGMGADHILSRIHEGHPPESLPLLSLERVEPQLKSIDPDVLDHLVESNRSIGNTLPEETVRRLKQGAQLVIAGQQPGLMLGPLYTFWKLITAVVLARYLSKNTGIDAVPAFWIASEDHDIFEVNRFQIHNEKFVAEPLEPAVRGKMPPVGNVSLEHHREPLLNFLKDTLKDKPFADWILESVSQSDFSGYGKFFSTLSAQLFGSLDVVFVDALELSSFASPHIARAVERYDAVKNAFGKGAEMLKDNGFAPPLSDPGIFEILPDSGGRLKCRFQNQKMQVSDSELPLADAADFIRCHPGRFSAGAALRPIVQDAVLPVVSTVCGPTELLYLWQIDPIYSVLNLTRSKLIPRINGTVLPVEAQRVISKMGGLKNALNKESQINTKVKMDDLDDMTEQMNRLISMVESIEEMDPKLKAKSTNSFKYQMEKIRKHVVSMRQSQGRSLERQSHRLNQWLLPGGKLQERTISSCEILAEYGPDWIVTIIQSLDISDGVLHRFVMMN